MSNSAAPLIGWPVADLSASAWARVSRPVVHHQCFELVFSRDGSNAKTSSPERAAQGDP